MGGRKAEDNAQRRVRTGLIWWCMGKPERRKNARVFVGKRNSDCKGHSGKYMCEGVTGDKAAFGSTFCRPSQRSTSPRHIALGGQPSSSQHHRPYGEQVKGNGGGAAAAAPCVTSPRGPFRSQLASIGIELLRRSTFTNVEYTRRGTSRYYSKRNGASFQDQEGRIPVPTNGGASSRLTEASPERFRGRMVGGSARLWDSPPDLIPLVLRKIHQESAEGILLGPVWKGQLWSQRITQYGRRLMTTLPSAEERGPI